MYNWINNIFSIRPKNEEKELTISKIIEKYKGDVSFDENMGEISINNETKIPYNKEIWTPKG